MAEKAQILLDIEAQGAAKTLGELETRAEALNEALKDAAIGSEEYKKLNQELINTSKQVKNLELGFEALDAEQVASEVGSVAGAIGDVATSMVLLSGGNEDLAEMAERIETALGVSMALKGSIEGLQSARKLWNDAMARGNKISQIAIALQQKLAAASKAALGVWALVITAIAAIAAAFLSWEKNATAAEVAQEKLNEAAQAGAKAAGEEEAKVRVLAATLTDATASTEDRKKALDELNAIMPNHIGYINEETIATGEAIEMIQEYIRTVKLRAELAAAEQILQEGIAERMRLQLEIQQKGADANSGIYKEAIEFQKQAENEMIKYISGLQQEVNALDQVNEVQGKVKKEVEETTERFEENTKATKDNTEAQEENNQAIIDKTQILAEVEKLENEYLDGQLDRQQQELNAVEDKYFGIIQEAKQNNIDIALLEEAKQFEIDEINARFEEERRLKEEERLAKERERAQAQADAMVQMAIDAENKIQEERERVRQLTIQGAQDLLNATEKLANFQSAKELKRAKEKVARGEKLTKAEIKRLERQDKINKAFAVAQIAADTARGIGAAIAAGAPIPFPGNLGAIASGIAAVIAGSVQAAQVLGESPDIPSLPETSADVFAESTDNAQGTPNVNDFGFGSTLLNQPGKVYVVESDITDAQNSVSVVEAQATFG